MKAIILAAGYATRLYPLTRDWPKALLKVGGKTILDRLTEQILVIDAIDEVHVVTNHKFANTFLLWTKAAAAKWPLVKFLVWDDGTLSNDTRLGALGDIQYVIDQAGLDDDVLITASDTFCSFDWRAFYADFQRHGRDLLLAHEEASYEDCKRYAVALLDEAGRVVDMEEKPEHPKSRTAVYAAYIYRRATLPLLKSYLDEGNSPDAPGHFPSWLYKTRDVRAFVFQGECVDIGTLDTYNEVCARYDTGCTPGRIRFP